MSKITAFVLAIGSLLYWVGTLAGPTQAAGDKTTAAVYKESCLRCHGEQGKGDGPATKTIKNMKMTDWTSKEAMAKYSDEDLYKIISAGGAAVGKSKLMPAYKDKMKEKEMRDLVAYVRSF